MKYRVTIVIILSVFLITVGNTYSENRTSGEALFNSADLGTNGKSCNTCHSGGKDIDGRKNTYTILAKKQDSIKDAVNFCIEMALSGNPLEKDSEKMEDIVSYLKTLKGKKIRKSSAPGY